jgi:hypothetical protein
VVHEIHFELQNDEIHVSKGQTGTDTLPLPQQSEKSMLALQVA